MKLLYTLTTYPPAIGGAQLHQHPLAQQLKQHHPIQVFTHWTQNRTDWLMGTTISQNPREIADAICQILMSPSQALKMRQNGKQKLHAKFTWSAIAEITENIYQRVTS